MEQARQLGVVFALEVRSELFRPARHAQEMFNERLIRVSEEWSGVHGFFSLHRLDAVDRTPFPGKPG